MAEKPPLQVLLCSPRGFCAGVDRAIQIVELALQRFGAPVYVRHEIVHNRYVVDGLRRKGAVFVETLDEIPPTTQPVIFSAHGVAKAVPEAAAERNLFQLDATCPLVTKVHREAEIHFRRGREIVLIGHAGHPEVDGTMGQLPQGAISLIEIVAPHKEDICYATTNRQEAVKRVAGEVDAMIVIGAPNSSNSQRLREVAERGGCPVSMLVQRASDIDWSRLANIRRVGVTAGASAPEVLVEEVLAAFAERYSIDVESVSAATEDITFNLPRALRDAAE
jgi:4-hydroxy-3-methylbut-2-enyl diphosphate reductase